MELSAAVPRTSAVPLALVIDPDEDTRKLHAITLRAVAADIEEAEDGAEGLAKAVCRHPALIVTELRLPRIDGYSLCGLLREEPNTRDAAILVVTGSAMPAQIERARRAGADDVLVKPADPESVRDRALGLLLKSQQLRHASVEMQQKMAAQVELSQRVVAEARRQRMMSRSYSRETTITPPTPPPALRCPECDQPLVYEQSNVGGVSAKFPEQWDYFKCVRCGTFQYRHRTRRLRRA